MITVLTSFALLRSRLRSPTICELLTLLTLWTAGCAGNSEDVGASALTVSDVVVSASADARPPEPACGLRIGLSFCDGRCCGYDC